MRPVVFLVCFFIASLTLAAVASRQQAPPRDLPRVSASGTASVSGTVTVDDETHAPLRRAIVSLVRAGIEDMRTTTSDDQGRYLFDGVPSGSYTLGATKPAYLGVSYGAPKPGMPGAAVVLADGDAFVAKPMALARGAVISGRLLDRGGQPVAGAMVEANQVVVLNGVRRRTGFRVVSTSTNAHGEYRVFGLRPGDYLVSSAPPPFAVQAETNSAELSWISRGTGAAPPRTRASTYAPTMFPGTADGSAGTVVSVARGEERTGVDFSMQFVPVARVSGVVRGIDGRPVPGALVLCNLKNPNPLLPPSGLPSSRATADGSFVCPSLTPGQYTLVVPGTASTGANSFGLAEITVAGVDLPNVVITIQTGLSVSGRVEAVAQGEAKPDLSQFRVSLNPMPGAPPIAGRPPVSASADGSVRLDGVVPGSYRISGTGPSGWLLRSAMLNGKDVADVPVEIGSSSTAGLTVTFTNAQPELFGTITDTDKRPAPQLYVVLFPADQSLWLQDSRRIRVLRSAENGSYSFAGLPAGDYYLCALTEFDTGFQFEPEYLRPFIDASIKVTLGDGEKKQQNLQIAR